MLDLTMERRIARNFYNKAKQLIPEDGEREQMFNILRAYQQSLDLACLLDQLKEIINEPIRLELFDAIRPLIPLKHQLEYDRLAPPVPGTRLRVIRLQRRTNESLGFAVRGGFEHGVGIYVSEVDTESQAYHYGLRVGDEVVRVNGFTIDQAIHEEVLNLIKAKPEIVLKVRTVGMIPQRENSTDSVSWKFIERPESKHSMSWQVTEKPGHRRSPARYSKLYVNLRGVNGLGCSISSGPVEFPGVFLKSIKAGSLAEEAGLGVGDQIIDVNGTSFLNITHSEAVVALKSSSELYITLHRGAGVELLKLDEQPISAQQATEEEKLRQFMNREKQEKERRILDEEAARREEKMRREAEQREKQQQQAEKEERARAEAAERERREKLEAAERERQEAERRQREYQEQQRTKERLREEAMQKSREIDQQRDQERQAIEKQKKEQSHLPDIRVSSPSSSTDNWQKSLSGPAFDRRPLVIEEANSRHDKFEDSNFDPKKLFNPLEIDGRQINLVKIKRDGALDIDIEGGMGTPLGGKIIISEVYPGGSVCKQGGVHKGDQLMMLDGIRLTDVTLAEAQSIVDRVTTRPGAFIKLVVAKSPPKNYEDEITYF